MALTPQDTSRIAHLARLELSAAEAPEMLRQLNDFFGIVEQMSAVDTRGVDPAAVKVGISISGVDPAAAADIESRLHREWRVDERGNYVLRISSNEPIHEPLMQMRVEVGDDRIQAVRELTLLFDPAPMPALPEEVFAGAQAHDLHGFEQRAQRAARLHDTR